MGKSIKRHTKGQGYGCMILTISIDSNLSEKISLFNYRGSIVPLGIPILDLTRNLL